MAKTKKKKPNVLLYVTIFATAAALTYFLFTKITGVPPVGPIPQKTPVPHVTSEPVATESNQLVQATAEDFKIAGISLQSTAEEITNIYGDPLGTKKEAQPSFQNPAYLVYLQTWIYPDLEVMFVNHAAKDKPAPVMPGTILTITVKSDLYPTKRGIKVGATLEQLFAQYGRIKAEEGTYTYNHELNYLEFTLKSEKITAITIGQNFD